MFQHVVDGGLAVAMHLNARRVMLPTFVGPHDPQTGFDEEPEKPTKKPGYALGHAQRSPVALVLVGQLLRVGSRKRRGLGDADNAIIFKQHASSPSSRSECIARSHARLRRASFGGGSRRGTTSVASAQISETAGPHGQNRGRTRTAACTPVRSRGANGRRAEPGRRTVRGTAARLRPSGRGTAPPRRGAAMWLRMMQVAGAPAPLPHQTL